MVSTGFQTAGFDGPNLERLRIETGGEEIMKKLVKHFTLGLAAILSGFGFVFATYDHFAQTQSDYRHMAEPPASTPAM